MNIDNEFGTSISIIEGIKMIDRGSINGGNEGYDIDLSGYNVYDVLNFALDKDLKGDTTLYKNVFIYNITGGLSLIWASNKYSIIAKLVPIHTISGTYEIITNTRKRSVVKGVNIKSMFVASIKEVIPKVEPAYYDISGASIEDIFLMIRDISGRVVLFKRLSKLFDVGVFTQWIYYEGSGVCGFTDRQGKYFGLVMF